jgi:hypothetical protein
MAATKAKPEAMEESDEILDTLAPAEIYYEIGEGDEKIVFVQKPLTFFGKIEFFSVVGKAVQKILIDGGSLSELLDTPEFDPTVPLASSVTDADVFVKALSKIVEAAPELLKDLYLVILAVPKGQRDYYALRLEELTDEQGMQILDVFVDQNWEVLTSFFTEKMLPLYNKISQKVQG